MGYTTYFDGEIAVTPPLNEVERAYLTKFANSRRMLRERGPYFVDGEGFHGQDRTEDVHDHNAPPEGQPGLWCQWVPNEDGTAIEWDQGEKFYDAPEWMAYLIEHFLQPGAHAASSGETQFAGFTFDHVLNGEITAEGEESYDRWRLVVTDNAVRVDQGRVVYDGPEVELSIGDKCPTCGEEWTGA